MLSSLAVTPAPAPTAYDVGTVSAVWGIGAPWDGFSVPYAETVLTSGGAAVDFADAWTTYQAWLQADRDASPVTVTDYGHRLSLWARFLEREGVAWEEAGPAELQRFLARPVSAGRRRGQPLAVNTRHTDTTTIHGFYRFAHAAGFIDHDPMALVRPPRRREGSPRSFTDAELRRILQAARGDDRLYLLCWLGAGEGLRRAEMAGLDLADFERDPWPGRLRVLGKGSRERWVPLSAKVRRVLERHLGDRANLTTGPLIANRSAPADGLRPGTVGDLLSAHIRACGIDHGSGHWLRHNFVYLALAAAEGQNLEETREAAGHADSRITRAYGRRYQWEVRRKVIDVFPDPEHDPEATP
jgi:site-specific recombinase XerD